MMHMTNGINSLRFFLRPLVIVAGEIEALLSVPGASLPGRSEFGVGSPPSSFKEPALGTAHPVYKRHSLFLPTIAVLSLCFCTLTTSAQSITRQRPYNAIAERNVFGLTPKPPPQVPQPPTPPLPKLKLTGITTIFGNKQALLKVEFPPQPHVPATNHSYILTEGQRDGPIEVLEVNEKLGQVKVNNSGTIMEVTFDKPSPGPTPPPAPTPRLNPAWRYPSSTHTALRLQTDR